MATYYVGKGGNDGNNGLTWAQRKLTLNGAEDIPVVANDMVYVGPGAYREMLTVDVSGNAGNEIEYIADTTGEHTDGVGGIVRITGSDNDQTAARNYCISSAGFDYRTFRGFQFDTASNELIDCSAADHWIIEDCSFQNAYQTHIRFNGTPTNNTVRRCMFQGAVGANGIVRFTDPSTQDDTDNLVENCHIFSNPAGEGVRSERIGGIIVRNCNFHGLSRAARVQVALAVGQTVDVENCILCYNSLALQATALGELVEDFNTFYGNSTDRNNVAVGANSVTYPALFALPLLHSGASQISGFKFPWWFGDLSEWSQIAALTGSNEPTEDLLGIARPTTASKNSWGPLQRQGQERDTGTTYGGASASLELPDAGKFQFKIPVDGAQITISCRVYREANYAGGNPAMIIKQPGQADQTTVDAGAAGAWNLLTDTLTPAADPEYVFVELTSYNTAVAGNYAVYFGDLAVTASPDVGDMESWYFDFLPLDTVSAAGGGLAVQIIAPSMIVR